MFKPEPVSVQNPVMMEHQFFAQAVQLRPASQYAGLGIEIQEPFPEMGMPNAQPLKTPFDGKAEALQAIIESKPHALDPPFRMHYPALQILDS